MHATGKANEISAQFRKQNSRENIARKKDQQGKELTCSRCGTGYSSFFGCIRDISQPHGIRFSLKPCGSSFSPEGSGNAVLVYMAEKSMLGG